MRGAQLEVNKTVLLFCSGSDYLSNRLSDIIVSIFLSVFGNFFFPNLYSRHLSAVWAILLRSSASFEVLEYLFITSRACAGMPYWESLWGICIIFDFFRLPVNFPFSSIMPFCLSCR